MKIKRNVDLKRIIGKVDNDFNLSESDWIPRAAAWIIDALSQMKCLPMAKKTRRLQIINRIGIFPCQLNATDIKVFDDYGCEIKQLEANNSCCNSGFGSKTNVEPSPEIAVIDDTNKTGRNFMKVATIRRADDSRNFVITNNGHIELNFDTDWINVQSFEPMTYYDDYYDCEVPMVYDNGILLEAISFYILYKYLSRGSHHPVYDLKSNSPVTNPYIQWKELKSKAITSVRNDLYNADGWRNFFYNSTFDPRR
jgi:hypothetical protein